MHTHTCCVWRMLLRWKVAVWKFGKIYHFLHCNLPPHTHVSNSALVYHPIHSACYVDVYTTIWVKHFQLKTEIIHIKVKNDNCREREKERERSIVRLKVTSRNFWWIKLTISSGIPCPPCPSACSSWWASCRPSSRDTFCRTREVDRLHEACRRFRCSESSH